MTENIPTMQTTAEEISSEWSERDFVHSQKLELHS